MKETSRKVAVKNYTVELKSSLVVLSCICLLVWLIQQYKSFSIRRRKHNNKRQHQQKTTSKENTTTKENNRQQQKTTSTENTTTKE